MLYSSLTVSPAPEGRALQGSLKLCDAGKLPSLLPWEPSASLFTFCKLLEEMLPASVTHSGL